MPNPCWAINARSFGSTRPSDRMARASAFSAGRNSNSSRDSAPLRRISRKSSVTNSVKTAVGKELTATKLKTAIGKVPTFKSLSDDNKTLKTELRNLTRKLEKLEGGGS